MFRLLRSVTWLGQNFHVKRFQLLRFSSINVFADFSHVNDLRLFSSRAEFAIEIPEIPILGPQLRQNSLFWDPRWARIPYCGPRSSQKAPQSCPHFLKLRAGIAGWPGFPSSKPPETQKRKSRNPTFLVAPPENRDKPQFPGRKSSKSIHFRNHGAHFREA